MQDGEPLTKEKFIEGVKDALSSGFGRDIIKMKTEALEMVEEVKQFDPVLAQMMLDMVYEGERRFTELRNYLQTKVGGLEENKEEAP